jgi:VCBS repeat-containing protein
VSAAGDTVVRGAYGTLTIHANGKYSYAADADILDTLSPGAVSPREIFTYTVSDAGNIRPMPEFVSLTRLPEPRRFKYCPVDKFCI